MAQVGDVGIGFLCSLAVGLELKLVMFGVESASHTREAIARPDINAKLDADP